jgi:hypothetical protein
MLIRNRVKSYYYHHHHHHHHHHRHHHSSYHTFVSVLLISIATGNELIDELDGEEVVEDARDRVVGRDDDDDDGEGDDDRDDDDADGRFVGTIDDEEDFFAAIGLTTLFLTDRSKEMIPLRKHTHTKSTEKKQSDAYVLV